MANMPEYFIVAFAANLYRNADAFYKNRKPLAKFIGAKRDTKEGKFN